ncbi:MAG: peptidyl-prolyl cis-trans isomerase SurA [Myxococcota bacterium]|jgi:peptidyl-prolyl cis-trans isomerase SurA
MRMFAAALLMACGSPTPNDPAPATVSTPIVTPASSAPVAVPPRLVPSGRYGASHILIDYDTAHQSTSARSQAQARTLAQSVHAQAVGGANFEALAAQHSADPNSGRGGRIGVFLAGTMMPEFESATAQVHPGEVAALTQTAYGFHIIRRDAVVEGNFRHMVVGFDGARKRDGTTTTGRDKTAARALLEAAQLRLTGGDSWTDVVRDVSEDNLARFAGDLGTVTPGQMVPDFEDAAFALQPGQRSGIVESPYGLHIIERY